MDGLTAWAGWTFPPGVSAVLYPTPATWQHTITPFIPYLVGRTHANRLLAIGNLGGTRDQPGALARLDRPAPRLRGVVDRRRAGAGRTVLRLAGEARQRGLVRGAPQHALVHSYSTTAGGNEYGAPAGRYRRLRSGVSMRRFAHGIVVVDPTAHAVGRVSLSGRYRREGATIRSVTVAPTSGLILLKAR